MLSRSVLLSCVFAALLLSVCASHNVTTPFDKEGVSHSHVSSGVSIAAATYLSRAQTAWDWPEEVSYAIKDYEGVKNAATDNMTSIAYDCRPAGTALAATSRGCCTVMSASRLALQVPRQLMVQLTWVGLVMYHLREVQAGHQTHLAALLLLLGASHSLTTLPSW